MKKACRDTYHPRSLCSLGSKEDLAAPRFHVGEPKGLGEEAARAVGNLRCLMPQASGEGLGFRP